MKLSKEFKIGFWTIVAIAVLFFGIQYLKGINSLKLGNTYYVSVESVDGLANSSPVRVNGYQVGLVRGMDFDYKNTGKIVVEINIEDSGLKLPVDTKAFVATDFLGTSTVVLELGSASTHYNLKDTICGVKQAGLMDAAEAVIPSITALIPKIDSLVAGVNMLVNESKMQESLLEIHQLTKQLNSTVATLNSMLKGEVPEILANVNSLTANVDTLTTQIKEADIAILIEKANTTLETTNKLLSAIASDEGSLGKAINTPELHDQLTETIASVDSLINDIKQNPKRYINVSVFGKK